MSLRKVSPSKRSCPSLRFYAVAPSWGQSVAPSGTKEIDVSADSLSFGSGGTQIEAKGSVEIKRQPTTIKADEVRINRGTNEMEAKGQVSLDDPNWKVKSAESMQFNLETETGELQKARCSSNRTTSLSPDKGCRNLAGKLIILIRDSSPPACVNPARRSGESRPTKSTLRLRAPGLYRHGYFYIYDVPVLYIPYGFIPLQSERQTGFLFPEFGQSNTDGFRYQQPFFWAISKSTDATFTSDVETSYAIGPACAPFGTKLIRTPIFNSLRPISMSCGARTQMPTLWTRRSPSRTFPRIVGAVNGTHRYTTATGWLTYSDYAAYSDTLFTRELVDRFDLPRKGNGKFR